MTMKLIILLLGMIFVLPSFAGDQPCSVSVMPRVQGGRDYYEILVKGFPEGSDIQFSWWNVPAVAEAKDESPEASAIAECAANVSARGTSAGRASHNMIARESH